MFVYILIAFIAIPVIELSLLIYLFKITGWEFSLGLIIFTGILGSFLAKRQGWQTWKGIKQDLATGTLPTTDLMHGLFILIAGALLLTPGIFTDITGFLLLVPAVRELAGKWLMSKLKENIFSGNASFQHMDMNANTTASSFSSRPSDDDDVIDVNATVTPEEKPELGDQ